jgi:hypothetical protein
LRGGEDRLADPDREVLEPERPVRHLDDLELELALVVLEDVEAARGTGTW